MKSKPKIVMAFGTFDLVHKGHIDFLKQAKGKGDVLVVSIARDENVKKFKGRKPLFTEKQRKSHVQLLGIADKVIFGDRRNYMAHIKKIRPDLIALGYDQEAYTSTLQKDLLSAQLKTKVLRMKPFKPEIYKSSKLKVKGRII